MLKSAEPYYSDLFFSKYTGKLIMTAAMPILDAEGRMYAVMDIDFRFDELVKLISPIPDEILQAG
ncbi:MAG: PDC sensor domain-containing protein [Spirochaetia bacterium]